MKKNLTIIIPIYNVKIPLNEIFYNIYKQKSQNFNIILTFDRPKEKDYIEIDKLQSKLGERLKIIFNSGHQHFDVVIKQALDLIETPYTFILYSYANLKNEFIQRFDNFIKSSPKKADFIQVPGYNQVINKLLFKSAHLSMLGLVNLETNKLPFILTSPFMFNSIVKTNILKKVFFLPKTKDLNLEYSPNPVFQSLLYSKTYAFFEDTWIINNNDNPLIFNPKSLTRNWNNIFNSSNTIDIETKNALELAKCLNYCYYIAAIVGSLKHNKNPLDEKTLISIKNSLIQEISILRPFWVEQLQANHFFKEFNIQKLYDLTSGFSKKWDHIIKKFIWP
ncbi:hypothetical protein [Mycoplasma sp. 2575]